MDTLQRRNAHRGVEFCMFQNIPSEIAGIPVWVFLFVIAGFILFFLKVSGDSVNQDRYPTTRLFLFIASILVTIAGVADFVRWANFW
jgi:hypothetical protein